MLLVSFALESSNRSVAGFFPNRTKFQKILLPIKNVTSQVLIKILYQIGLFKKEENCDHSSFKKLIVLQQKKNY